MALVRSPDGQDGYIPDEQVDEALRQGYKLRTESGEEKLQREAQNNEVQTGIEGAIQALPFGASVASNVEGFWQGKSSEDIAREMKIRQEANPKSHIAGEVVGAVLPALATGGISGLAGGGIKGLLTEAGAWGLNSAYNDSVLENKDLTAEQAAASVAANVLTAGALHGTLSIAGKLGNKIMPSIEEVLSKKSDAPLKAAEKAGILNDFKSAGGDLDKFKEILDSYELRSGGKAYNQKLIDSIDSAIKNVNNDESAMLDKLFLNKIEDIPRPAEKVYAKTNPGFGRVQGAGPRINPSEEAFKNTKGNFYDVIGNIEDKAKKFLNNGELENILSSKINNELAQVHPSWDALLKYGNSLDNTQIGQSLSKAIRAELIDTVGNLEPEIKQAFEEIPLKKLALGSYKKLVESKIEDIPSIFSVGGAFGRLGTAGGAFAINPVAGGAALGGFVGEALLKKLSAQRGDFLAKFAADKIINGGALEGLSKVLGGRISTILENMPSILGPSLLPIQDAMAKGGFELLNEHIRQASGPNKDNYLAAMGMRPEGAGAMDALVSKIEHTTVLQNAAQLTNDKNEKTQKQLLNSNSSKIVSSVDVKTFDAKINSINNLLLRPQNAFKLIPPGMQSALPATSGQMISTILNGAKFLKEKMPKIPNDKPKAFGGNSPISDVDKTRWLHYYEAISDPATAIAKLSHGQNQPEYKEALKAIYPNLYKDFQRQLATKISSISKPLPYSKQIVLGIFLKNTGTGLNPQNGAILQSIHNENSTPKQKSKVDGRQVIDVQKNQQTQAQRIEAKQ